MFRYLSCLMEPWDGPAFVVYTDGRQLGACLDRNGLRPGRFAVTKDRLLVLASEAGALAIHADNVVAKGRLRPGKLLLLDMTKGTLEDDDELKDFYASRYSYGSWLQETSCVLPDFGATTYAELLEHCKEETESEDEATVRRSFTVTSQEALLGLADSETSTTTTAGVYITFEKLGVEDPSLRQKLVIVGGEQITLNCGDFKYA